MVGVGGSGVGQGVADGVGVAVGAVNVGARVVDGVTVGGRVVVAVGVIPVGTLVMRGTGVRVGRVVGVAVDDAIGDGLMATGVALVEVTGAGLPGVNDGAGEAAADAVADAAAGAVAGAVAGRVALLVGVDVACNDSTVGVELAVTGASPTGVEVCRNAARLSPVRTTARPTAVARMTSVTSATSNSCLIFLRGVSMGYHCSVAGAQGMAKAKREPTPTSLSTQMRPL